MNDEEELWQNDRNIIITEKKQVDTQQFFLYLKKEMSSFSKESTFFIITGHHHVGLDQSNVAVVGETDSGLHASIGSNLFKLDEEQEEYLKMVVEDSETKKDLIIAGKCFLI